MGTQYRVRDNLSQLADQVEEPSVPLYRYESFAVVIVERNALGEVKEHKLFEAGGKDAWYYMRKHYLKLTQSTPYKVEPRLLGLAYE